MSAPPAVVIKGLRKSFDERLVLRLNRFDFRSGACTWVTGPNGCGKSTLLRILAGLLLPDEGDIRVAGHVPGSRSARRVVSLAPDVPALYDDLSIDEHCDYVAALHGLEPGVASRRRGDLLEVFGLADRREDLPRTLSRGLRQRMSLLLASFRPWDVLMLDEPFENLDPSGVDAIAAVIREGTADGKTAIVTGQRLPASLDSGARLHLGSEHSTEAVGSYRWASPDDDGSSS